MSTDRESQAARYGAEALMNMAGALAERAESKLSGLTVRRPGETHAEVLSRVTPADLSLVQTWAALASAYAGLAQAAAIQEGTEAVAGALADVVSELASLGESGGAR